MTQNPSRRSLSNRLTRFALATILSSLFIFQASASARSILTLYSDGKQYGDNFWTWSAGGTIEGTATDCPGGIPNGWSCTKVYTNLGLSNYAGYEINYNTPLNLTSYAGGRLRFWIYSNAISAKVEMSDSGGHTATLTLAALGWTGTANSNVWTLMDIPISSFTAANPSLQLNSINNPFMFTLTGSSLQNSTVYIDLVRWTTGVALNTVYADLTDVQTQTAVNVSSITWAPVIPSTWNASPKCLKIDYDPGTIGWRIRLYTDNKNAAANPKYVGTSPDAAGLLFSTGTATSMTPLRMSWDIEDSTRTMAELGAAGAGTWVTDGFSFKWFKDMSAGTLDSADLGYVSPWSSKGVLYADWDSGGSDTRVWKNSPNYIYFGTNMQGAFPGYKYKTNMLILELYYD